MVKQKNAQTTFVHNLSRFLPTDMKVGTRCIALLRAEHLKLLTETLFKQWGESVIGTKATFVVNAKENRSRILE